MLTGTRRNVVEVLLGGEASATDIADELDVSIQTVHRHLESLREDGYVRESGTRSGTTRPYKLYAVEETGSLFSIHDGKLVERTLQLGGAQKLLFSILEVPQEEFHFPLLSYLVGFPETTKGIVAIAVYGSVARGDATEESDIDLLFVTDTDDATLPDSPAFVPTSFDHDGHGDEETSRKRVVTVESFTKDELRDGMDLDSQFLRNAVNESIILYDPDDVLREAKAEYVEQGRPSGGVSGRGEGHS